MIDKLQGISIVNVTGMTPKMTDDFHRLGIFTVSDLLTYFPKSNQYRKIKPKLMIPYSPRIRYVDGTVVQAKAMQDSPALVHHNDCGASYLEFHCVVLGTGDEFWLHAYGYNSQIGMVHHNKLFNIRGIFHHHPSHVNVYKTPRIRYGYLRPYYPLTVRFLCKYPTRSGISQQEIRGIILRAYKQYRSQIAESVPMAVRNKYHLLDHRSAIFQCHFPYNAHLIKQAIYTEKFIELYRYTYKLQKIHLTRKRKSGFQIKYLSGLMKRFELSLPYRLTGDQKRAAHSILHDLSNPYRMHRLLQGDVGSGKTVVAAFAALDTIKAGYQVALMIPTTILGSQHYATFTNLFKSFNVHIATLTGETPLKRRNAIIKGLKDGSIDLIIGTEALYQKNTKYRNLGLVIIDEQHRFGVRQRRSLEGRSKKCNVLSMTATPIPRTLAIAAYGGADVSQIKQMPKGRKPIETNWYEPSKNTRQTVLHSIIRAVKHHNQVFVITKLVQPSQYGIRYDIPNSITTAHVLSKLLKPYHISVHYVHGRMGDQQKNVILRNFQRGKFSVLVATSVVGVGVDIPHANLIVILNAELYGLAQLHQLRGRVGRNSSQARCILVGSPNTEASKERLKVMKGTNDGFKIAKADLRIRHSGNLVGQSQSGIPKFGLVNLSDIHDFRLMTKVSKVVSMLLKNKYDIPNNRPA